MAINDIVQTIAEARVDARSLSEFVFKPANFTVTRRLAPSVRTLQYYIDIFDNLDVVLSSSVIAAQKSLNSSVAEAQGKVAYIETTVQDAINNTAVEGGVLADTFVTVTANGTGTVARSLRDVNSDSINVKSFGAVGDGVTEDTDAFQAAFDYCSSIYTNTGKPVTMLIPDGVYVLLKVRQRAGVDMVGVGSPVLLKKPAGDETDQGILKWWVILSVDSNTYEPKGMPIHRRQIRNIIFDGNRDNMNWAGGYSQEQGHCILIAKADNLLATAEDRFKLHIENCTFINSVGDGMSVNRNVDLTFNNIKAEDCYRGGLTVTGGNTYVNGNNYIGIRARIDIEVDGIGFEGAKFIHYKLDNIITSGLDFGEVGKTGSGLLTNSEVRGSFNFHNNNVNSVKSINCKFYMNEPRPNGNRFFGAHGEFIDCEFIAEQHDDRSTSTLIRIDPRSIPYTVNKPKLLFERCSFSVSEAVYTDESVTKSAMMYIEPTLANWADDTSIADVPNVVFKDCYVSKGFDHTFRVVQGGRLTVDGIKTESTGSFLYIGLGTNRPYFVDVRGFNELKSCAYFLDSPSYTGDSRSLLSFNDCTVDNKASNARYILNNAVVGIVDYLTPSSPVGNVFTPKFIRAVNSNYRAGGGRIPHRESLPQIYSWLPIDGSTSGDTYLTKWGVVSQAPMRGTTLQRPATLTTNDYGFTYFDSNLNKLIWWDSSKWVDYMGTVV